MTQNFDFTKYSYEDLVKYINDVVKDSGAWKDAQDSSIAQVLIQAIAAGTDQLHYMLERRTQETFFPTAQLDSTVGALASLSGYRPQRAVSARGGLDLRLVDKKGNDLVLHEEVFIPRYTKIQYEDTVFVTLQEVLLTTSTKWPVRLDVAEGEINQKTFNTDNETTFINGSYINVGDFTGVDEYEFQVTANGENYYDVRTYDTDNAMGTLTFARPSDPVYDIRVAHDGLRVVFGNGEYGKKPSGFIGLSYLATKGKSVEIPQTGTDFQFVRPIRTSGGDLVKYELQNGTPISGGRDAETVGQTKVYAPEYNRSNNRAVTKRDFDFWLLRSPLKKIVDIYTYTEEELDVLKRHVNTVFVSYLTEDGKPLDHMIDAKALETSKSEKQQFIEYINDYKTLTTHIALVNVNPVELKIDCRVHLNPDLGVPTAAVYDSLNRALNRRMDFGPGSLGKPLHSSEIIYDLMTHTMNITGIEKDVIKYIDVDIRPSISHKVRKTGRKVILEVTPDMDFETDDDPLTAQSTITPVTLVVDGQTINVTASDFGGSAAPLVAANAIASKLRSTLSSEYTIDAPTVEPFITISRKVGLENVDVTADVTTDSGNGDTHNVRVHSVQYAHTHEVSGNVDLYYHTNNIKVPQKELVNRARENFIVKGSVELYDSDGNLVAKDNHPELDRWLVEVDENGDFVDKLTAKKYGRVRYGDENIEETDINHFDGLVTLYDVQDDVEYFLQWSPIEAANLIVSPQSAIGIAPALDYYVDYSYWREQINNYDAKDPAEQAAVPAVKVQAIEDNRALLKLNKVRSTIEFI